MKTLIFYLLIITVSACIGKDQGDDFTLLFKDLVVDKAILEKRIDEMEGLSNEMKKFLYHFRLLSVDSSLHINEFIKYFPEDYKDIMCIIYEKIELQKLTPYFLYSFELLGNYAVKNGNDSIRKLFIVYCRSDGIVAELLSDYILILLKSDIKNSVLLLNSLDSKDQQKILMCLKMLPEKEAKKLRKKIEKLSPKIIKNDEH